LRTGDGVDHLLVEFVGDRDPDDRANGREGERFDEIELGGALYELYVLSASANSAPANTMT
jgi:hypothetical protein